MNDLPYSIRYQGSCNDLSDSFEDQLSGQTFLSDVVDWLGRLKSSSRIVDVIVQDEFSHDVIVQYDSQTYLVYDAT